MTTFATGPTWVAFDHHRRTARGSPAVVISALQHLLATQRNAMPVVLDAGSSERIELDWRLPLDALLALVPDPRPAHADNGSSDEAPRGPGRPKLGVTAREVTLLPRHWDWLSRQPGGASVALRKLVQAAMRESSSADAKRRATDAAYRFMSTVGGDLPEYEEISRALFSGDLARVDALLVNWPADVADHLRALLSHIDAPEARN
jgi:uncharacterized protein